MMGAVAEDELGERTIGAAPHMCASPGAIGDIGFDDLGVLTAATGED